MPATIKYFNSTLNVHGSLQHWHELENRNFVLLMMRKYAVTVPCSCKLHAEEHFAMCLLQARYADGTKKMLQSWFDEKDFPEEWYIVREGELADQYK